MIDRSPCEGLTAPSPERRRDRVLSDEEIRIAWRAFDSAGWPFGPIGQLLLLTGARKNEVAGMKWSEIDLDARIWSLPQERTKNKRDHELPLSAAAVRIIEGLPRIGDKMRGFVFTTTGKSAVSGFSRFKTTINKTVLELSRGKPRRAATIRQKSRRWPRGFCMTCAEPLRRTCRSWVSTRSDRGRFEPRLGHSRRGCWPHQRHDYRDEKRQALDVWARYLGAIINGEGPANLVRLARTKR